MVSTTSLSVLNIAAYLGNALVTYGVGTGAFSKLPTNEELSRKYQTLITPAGWAFSIWGLIFVSQFIWVSQARRSVQPVGLNYVGVCVAQMVWTLAFAQEFMVLAMAAMLAILVFLVIIVHELDPLSSGYNYNRFTKLGFWWPAW
jgi:hypothetical protein